MNDLLRPRIRYLGTDETILSLQAMCNIYKMVAHNLKTAHKQVEKEQTKFPTRVKTEDLIMLKRHDKKTFEPVYEGYYRVLKTRGNQVRCTICFGRPGKNGSYVDTVDTGEGVCNGFLALYTFFWFPEFSGYHQWQQESQ